MNSTIETLINHGQLSEALERIDQFSPLLEVEGKILTSRIYELQGRYTEALEMANQALALCIEQGKKCEELGARIALAYAQVRLHHYDDCSLTLTEAKSLLNSITHDNYLQLRKHEATLYNVEGLMFRFTGDLDRALACYQHSYEIRSKLGCDCDMAASLTNIGTIYQIKGELDTALEYHHRAREIFISLDNNLLLAFTCHDIGEIYWELNNYKKAAQYYDQALKIRLKHKNQEVVSKTLLDLILLHLEFSQSNSAKHYFDILEEIKENDDGNLIQNYYDIAHAMILKNSPRLVKRAQAQLLLEVCLDRPLDNDLRILTMLNLCDIYILDLKLSKNEEIIKKVEDLIGDLLRFVKRQHSKSLHIEVILLQSKLALVKLDLDTARHLLFQAELMANEHHLHHLAMKASAEHDELVNKLRKWEKLQRRNASIIERMNEVNLAETIDHIRLRRRDDEYTWKIESPLFLLILNQDLVTIFSTTFNTDLEVNEDLIGSFLMASDMGMGLALHTEEKIERIKYGEYQLIFIHHDKMIFCYAYEGQSYFAIKRLRDFIDRIRLGRSWQLLSASVPRPKLIEEDLEPKIDDYFSPTGIYSQQLFD